MLWDGVAILQRGKLTLTEKGEPRMRMCACVDGSARDFVWPLHLSDHTQKSDEKFGSQFG